MKKQDNESLIQEIQKRLDWYTMEASDEEFDADEVQNLLKLLDSLIPEEEKERRREILVELQDAVMDEFSQKLVGTTQRVLCCGYDPEHEMFYGRTYMDSPDVDGIVYFYADEPVEEGTFVPVKIENAVSAELFGEIAQGPDEEMDQ